jgi:DNA repair exonuclease SbcCD ATPase subunit
LKTVEQRRHDKSVSIGGLRAISESMPADVTDEMYAAAIADCESQLKDCNTYLECAAGTKDQYQLANFEHGRVKAAADQAAAMRTAQLQKRAVHEHFKQLAAIYHHDAAPKDLTQRNLELCQARLNTILAEFGAKFSSTVREDLSFDCIFPDKVQPAHRLSCGQRVVLALCLRIALVTTLLPEVGLLLLDEPTTFLDADTIKSFNSALEKLREFAVAANIQVVIVTHCTDLIPAFDGVIQL